MQQSCPAPQPPPGQASAQLFVLGSQISEALAQQAPLQAACPAGQQGLPAPPQEPPAFAVPWLAPHNPELGLHTHATILSLACITVLLLGALNPLTVTELSAQDVTVTPTGLEFKELPACQVGAAVVS